MAEYVNIRIRKDTYERLKELSAGVPLVRFLDDACRHWSQNGNSSKDEADALVEQLDAQSNDPYAKYRNLDDGELPECCQGIYSGIAKNRCEHWEWVNGGWRNKITNKYASDGEYVNYMENR